MLRASTIRSCNSQQKLIGNVIRWGNGLGSPIVNHNHPHHHFCDYYYCYYDGFPLVRTAMRGIRWHSSRNGSILTKATIMPTMSSSKRCSSILLGARRTIFSFRNNSSNNQTAVVTAPTKWGTRLRRLAWLLRYLRIPFLVVSVYSVGYQQGVIDCTRTPQILQANILKSVLYSAGVTSMEQVRVVSDNEIRWSSRQPHHQVAQIGSRIITAAKQYVQEELDKAIQQVNENLPPDTSPEQQLLAYNNDETVQLWYNARLRLYGEQIKDQPWQYIFIESDVPNAFVSEILPQRFFITTAMLNVATTPDELAMVLGHETSHLILGHVTEANHVELFLQTLQILLLAMDPTEGTLSILVVWLLAWFHNVLTAAHSRGKEYEADDLGLILAARACFDTQAGTRVLYKMHELAVAAANPNTKGSILPGSKTAENQDNEQHHHQVLLQSTLLDTHPPSFERYERMKVRSEVENASKYAHTPQCATLTRRLFQAMWKSSSSSSSSPKPSI